MVQYAVTGHMNMDWIDQNLDAYRVIAEILCDLRPLVRDRLEARHGKEWFRDGIPEQVFERLILNKEQEASIDWYENRYQEVISYAVFPDLFDIIIANPGLFDPILKLAPSESLLSTRFLELEVMRSKIGRAREISDAEINFLTSFHLRFRKAIEELEGAEVDTSAPPPRAAARTSAPTTGAKRAEPEPTPAQTAGRPPQRLASSRAEPAPSADEDPVQPGPVTIDVEEDEAPAPELPPDADQEAKPRETTSSIVRKAMESNDDRTVLRELYREVTGIAEVIWATEEIPTTATWDRVSTNPWYEANFSRLELRPLSDFYELISQVRAKRKAGAAKAEIQSFLNDSKFATVLLALRDMFQKNKL